MTLTQKEHDILNDLKTQEQLCIIKYTKYESEAHDPALREIFSSIKSTESNHLATIERMIRGEEVTMPAAPKSALEDKFNGSCYSGTKEEKDQDCYLCRDALSMEKHVSNVYNTGVFEFNSPVLRDTLAHIQKEEQNHGEKLYSYMSACSMY
jgi:spore coat protein CotF